MFDIDPKTLLSLGGVALLGLSILVVNRYNLHRGGIFAPLVTPGANKLPTIAALAFGLAGGILVYLGVRAA